MLSLLLGSASLSAWPPPSPGAHDSPPGEGAALSASSASATQRSRQLWAGGVWLVGLLLIEALLLLVGTALPWRVVDGAPDASVNGVYNFNNNADNNPYLGPPIVLLALVMIIVTVVALVLAGRRSKHARFFVAVAAGLAILSGTGAWLLAFTNRRTVVDPGDYDLNWFTGNQKVGLGLWMVLATSGAIIVTGVTFLGLALLTFTRPVAHAST